jgi:hypothetical protein
VPWTAAVTGLALGSLALGILGTVSAAATEKPLPAGPHPSHIAKMVCQAEAQKEMADALGLKATVADDSWADHRYTCDYVYPTGRFVLSVQEESSWSETFSYYRALGRRLGNVRTLANLGQGAFQTTDGSVVVRKDWKVLLVNISALPAQFAVPPTSAANVAVTVADVILGCWDGD